MGVHKLGFHWERILVMRSMLLLMLLMLAQLLLLPLLMRIALPCLIQVQNFTKKKMASSKQPKTIIITNKTNTKLLIVG